LQLIALGAQCRQSDGLAAAQITRRFGQGARGHDELFTLSDPLVKGGREFGQPVAVGRHHRQRLALDLEQRAHQDRAARFFAGGGKNCRVDAVAEPLAGDAEMRAARGRRKRRVLFGRKRVKIVVAALALHTRARRRSGELERARTEISEVARKELRRHCDRAALGDLGGERVLERHFQVCRANGDLIAVTLKQDVGEDRHGRVRVDDFAGGADGGRDVLGATGESHRFHRWSRPVVFLGELLRSRSSSKAVDSGEK
jgi:hypothetical protein